MDHANFETDCSQQTKQTKKKQKLTCTEKRVTLGKLDD